MPHINMLNQDQKYRLRTWIQGNASRLDDKVDVHQAARMAAKDLGFEVTENNIRGVNRFVGVKLRRKKGSGGKQVRKNDRLFAKCLIEVLEGLGMEVPDELYELRPREGSNGQGH